MKELSILFVNSVNDSLLNNFKDEEQIKDYFEINKFKASKKEMLLVPKLYLKNEKDTILVSIDDSLNKNELCELGSKVRNKIDSSFISYLVSNLLQIHAPSSKESLTICSSRLQLLCLQSVKFYTM